MKKLLLLAFAAVLFVSNAWAQAKSGDADLDRRLSEYMQYTEKLDFEKIMDYMYPKLFKIAPKEALVSAMKEAFQSKEMKMGMKDLGIVSIEDVFASGGTDYRKVTYKMTLTMQFYDTTMTSDPQFMEMMKESMAAGFPDKEVTVDDATKTIKVKGNDILFAIRDSGKEWMFIGYKDDPDLIKIIFPKPVIDYYKLMP